MKYPLLLFPVGTIFALIGYEIQDRYPSNFLIIILGALIVFLGGVLVVYSVAKYQQNLTSWEYRNKSKNK